MSVLWAGVHVRIIRGEYKSYQGYVYDVRPDDKSISGLKMVLELGTHIYPTSAAARITVDYDDVREFQHWKRFVHLKASTYNILHILSSPTILLHKFTFPIYPNLNKKILSATIPQFLMQVLNSSDDEMKPQDAHWILHPSFNNHCLHVTIDHPKYGTIEKWIDIRNDKEYIQKPKISPRHTSKSILAIIDGEHHGRFVQCIGKGKREGKGLQQVR
ncbi:hypothetical protein EV360DRAFT_76180 [Lentinula raphanica]|nr:hypothetical protein EV360DRAFT_76180 [Lentinula raphanica]